MKFISLILICFIAISCNPCKQIAKHPECFPVDTLQDVQREVRYEKIYITEDSIVIREVPCDTVKATAEVEIVYKTIYKTKIDTFYMSHTKTKTNPVNVEMQRENEKLIKKLERKKQSSRILITILVILILVFIAVRLIK